MNAYKYNGFVVTPPPTLMSTPHQYNVNVKILQVKQEQFFCNVKL